jgi:hypothetical protein
MNRKICAKYCRYREERGTTRTDIVCLPIIIMKKVEVYSYRDSSLGNRDPYVGILVPTRDPLPSGTLGKLVLHRNG